MFGVFKILCLPVISWAALHFCYHFPLKWEYTDNYGRNSNLLWPYPLCMHFLESQAENHKDAQQSLRKNTKHNLICKPQIPTKCVPFDFNDWPAFISVPLWNVMPVKIKKVNLFAFVIGETKTKTSPPPQKISNNQQQQKTAAEDLSEVSCSKSHTLYQSPFFVK